MSRKILQVFWLLLFLPALALSSSAQTPARTWHIDANHSDVLVSVGPSADSNRAIGAARVSGALRIDSRDPGNSSLVIDVFPSDAIPPAKYSDTLTTPEGSRLGNYTTFAFRSDSVKPTDGGKLAFTGDLTVLEVEQSGDLEPNEAYAGPVNSAPVVHTLTRKVTIVLDVPDAKDDPDGRVAVTAVAAVPTEDFPGLRAALLNPNWPPVVQDRNCSAPATVDEAYSGASCTGTPVDTPGLQTQLIPDEGYHGGDAHLVPARDKVFVALDLRLS